MNHSGDAAEQIVRLSLEGGEVALKVMGKGAKELLLLLVAAVKSRNSTLKPKGKARLVSMLKSGKQMETFSVSNSDLKKFAEGAKKYGIVYCVLHGKKKDADGMSTIMIKDEDAPRISRMMDDLKFAMVDRTKIESELLLSKEAAQEQVSEPEARDVNDTDKLLDALMGTNEGKAEPNAPEAISAPEAAGNPEASKPDFFTEKTAGSRPSEASSECRETGTQQTPGTADKPSVKEELREIKAARQGGNDEPKRDGRKGTKKTKRLAETRHKQPQNGGKRLKSKPGKERA